MDRITISTAHFQQYTRLAAQPFDTVDYDLKVDAIYWVAYCFLHGIGGVPKNRLEARKILTRLMDTIPPDNIHDKTGKHRHLLGLILSEGERASELYSQAVPRLRYEVQQAEDGSDNFCETAYGLGRCLWWGRGVGRNRRKSVRWMKTAAEQGHGRAQSFMYSKFCGLGFSRVELRIAFGILDWYKQLANDQGIAWAQRDLGIVYEKASGPVLVDLVQAVVLYNKAIAGGDKHATRLKGDLKARCSPIGQRRIFGVANQKLNIEKVNKLSEQENVPPLGLWALVLGSFQNEEYPKWEAPSPTYQALCSLVPQLGIEDCK